MHGGTVKFEFVQVLLIWAGDIRRYIIRCYSQSSTTGPFEWASFAKQRNTHTHTPRNYILKTNTILCAPLTVILLWSRCFVCLYVLVISWGDVLCTGTQNVPTLLCPVMPNYTLSCSVMPRYAILCPIMPCHAPLCPVMPCYVPLSPVMLCYAPLCHVMSHYALSCSVMPCYAPLCPAWLIQFSLRTEW